MPLEAQRILVTGGSGGLGRLICAGLKGLGAAITVLDRAAPPVAGVGFLEADLSTVDGIETAAARAGIEPWDMLINLAGVQYFGPFEDQPADNLLAGYLVNLVAPARLTQAVLPGMKARRSGRIVNIGSIFGSIGFANFASYSSAKAGLRGLSQALRRELAATGVKVTYIAPRAVRTALNSPLVLKYAELTAMNMDAPERVAERIVQAIAAGRRDVYLGFPESFFVRVNALAPGLVDRALRASDIKARTLFTPQPG